MKQEIKAIVTDIEGTTSSLAFVKDTLFPYASKNLPDFIWDNEREEDVAALLDEVRKEERNPELNLQEVIEVLLRYIEEDQKITALKALQGMIWEEGYQSGDLVGHIYEDAMRGLKRWQDQNIQLYVYSSGSIAAQKLIFGHTEYGDLTSLFSGYYDTTTGSKKETESYEAIAADIGFPVSEILFLSDSTEEINAAAAAGMNVMVLDREKALFDAMGHNLVNDFDVILNETVEA